MLDFIFDFLTYDVGDIVQPAWIGAAIGAASAIANGIFGSASARKQQKEQEEMFKQERAAEQARFDRRYNEDASQRADAQRLFARANEENKKRTQAAMGRKAVIGGTDAAVAGIQEANAGATSNALADITAQAEARKDAMEEAHAQRLSTLNQQEQQLNAQAEASKRQAIAQAASGVIASAASMADLAGEKKTTQPYLPKQSVLDKMSKTVQDRFGSNLVRNPY